MPADVMFTTNPAEWTRLEGLYVSEHNPPGFIRGVNLGVVGLAGKCVRGPTDHPVEITSIGRFLEVFGARDYTAKGTGGARVGEVHGALVNKRFGKIVVRRVALSTDVKASFTDETAAAGGGTPVLRIDASSVGLWGNNVYYKIAAATDAIANHFNLTVMYLGQQVTYENLDITTGNDNLSVTVGTDDARLVDLVKLADGRPVNTTVSTDGADATGWIKLGQTGISGFTGVAGTSGAPAVGDYNTGVNALAVYPGIGIVTVPEVVPTLATYHSNLVTLAAQVSDRIFLTWAHAHGVAVATEIAQVAAQITTRSDRIWWCKNSPYTNDPDTGAEMQTGPHVWLASELTQIDVDVHPGAYETQVLLAGIKRLTETTLTRADLIALREAGISTLERLDDGFQFRSVVTTDLTDGKTEGTRRRMADFLQLSASNRLRHYVKVKNTASNRAAMAAELTAFSADLRSQERIIEDFTIDQASVNNPTQRGQGLEKLLWRVRLIGHTLYLVLETEIGTGVVIEQQAA